MKYFTLARFFVTSLSLLWICSSCKSLYDRNTFLKESAQGNLSDEEWAFVLGYTDAEAKRPEGVSHILVLMPNKTKFACPRDSDKTKSKEVVIAIDGKLGDMVIGGDSGQYETGEMFKYKPITRNANVSFFDPNMPSGKEYVFAKSGRVRITKMTKDLIEGFVLAKASPSNFVNGRFKVKLCRWGQLN